ncbi:MAG: amidohydrolase family protein [Planctomycetaceae bacterium]|nr:amidohydrolase family protein [Planctomycetaceae bacterium]
MKTKAPIAMRTILLSLSFCLLSAAVFAQTPAADEKKPAAKEGATAKKSEDKPAKPEDGKSSPEKKADEKPVTAIVGGDVYTVTQEVIRRGTVLVQDGKILDVGRDVKVPEGATVIDAKGMIVTPGFVSITTRGVGLDGTPSTTAKLADLLDPFDANVKIALGVGITTACIQSSSSRGRFGRRAQDELFVGLDPTAAEIASSVSFNIDFGDPETAVCKCCGLPILPTEPIERATPQPIRAQKNAVIKMSAGRLDGMLVTDSVFYNVTPGSLTGALNRHTWRETIAKARDYLKQQAEHEAKVAKKEKSRPPRKPVSDDVLALVQKKTPLRISCDSVSAIREMLDLAEELDYDLVIDGATEGWVIPEELAEAGVPVIITPRRRRQPQLAHADHSGSNIESSQIFEDSGVPFGIAPLSSSISLNGLAGRDLTSLPLEAAFAVRGGCTEQTALRALTIVPARMLGLEDRIGSIEAGKDADLLILNGQPTDYRTYVETALVNGHVVYERNADRVMPTFER